jgi:3-dehydroquinate synthase
MDIKEVLSAMQHDKKVQQAKVRFVLLKSIGDAVITDEVDPSLVEEVLLGDY